MTVRRGVHVAGIVQGVGFRPYVFRLATETGLTGNVTNTAGGVEIEVEGPAAAVDGFLRRLGPEAPPLARVTGVEVRELPCNGDREFAIVASRHGDAVRTLIPPDVATCDDCLRELFTPSDRRYRYPFINCTNCGPRFTITRALPYDRPSTSMAPFRMCAECQAEYDDPRNRRFHAQPNACWACGPMVELRDAGGRPVPSADPVALATEKLAAGDVVAVKGLGGFHLAVDATNAAAVDLLRARKRRVEKPFAVMVRALDTSASCCVIDEDARSLLLMPQRPIVLLPWRKPGAIADAVAPFNRYLGLFLPYTPIHHLLFAAGRFTALVMTSGNLSEEPIAIDNDEAVARLHGIADWFLVHNRDILLRCDDSVVRPVRGRSAHQRRSRGYVPVPVFLARELPPILAVGGELKNTICVTKGRHAFLSQHIGDLENLESYHFFEEAVEHLARILEIEPAVVAYDLHPDYFSTRWALRQDAPKIGVQHHHAHVASCMAENGLDGRVIGLALDGTGYGTDGTIWGGEVLLACYDRFERAAHLACTCMPGGTAAIRQPWRMAVSHLWRHFGEDFLELPIDFVRNLPRAETRTLLRMIESGFNSPLTSSAGRLFDAVAALIGLRSEVNYEAQAAIELEMAIGSCADDQHYPITLAGASPLVLDPGPMLEAIVRDLERGIGTDVISRRFHMGIVHGLCDVAIRLREDTGLRRVCLSGGTFQNLFLLQHLTATLEAHGFSVYCHAQVPAGDGGLSLGQALIAAQSAACK